MKKIAFLTCACLFFISCSNDNNNDAEGSKTSEIVGTWAVTSADFGGDTNDAEASLKNIVEQLAGKGCPLITYTFDADGKLSIYNISEALSEEELQSGDVSCPASGAGKTSTGTYTYENSVLKTNYTDNGDTLIQSVPITISGNTMKAKIEDLFGDLPDGVDGNAQVILTKS